MSEELRVSAIETRGVAGKKRYAMVVDTRRCIGCMACQVACKAEYDTQLGVNRTWVPYKVVGTYPNVKKQFLPRLCNHCDDPPCVRNCPVDATYKAIDEIVGAPNTLLEFVVQAVTEGIDAIGEVRNTALPASNVRATSSGDCSASVSRASTLASGCSESGAVPCQRQTGIACSTSR